MRCKVLFVNSLNTLLFAWGGDAPPEAVWTFNELVEWLEEEYSVTLPRLNENLSNIGEMFDAIETVELKSL